MPHDADCDALDGERHRIVLGGTTIRNVLGEFSLLNIFPGGTLCGPSIEKSVVRGT